MGGVREKRKGTKKKNKKENVVDRAQVDRGASEISEGSKS